MNILFFPILNSFFSALIVIVITSFFNKRSSYLNNKVLLEIFFITIMFLLIYLAMFNYFLDSTFTFYKFPFILSVSYKAENIIKYVFWFLTVMFLIPFLFSFFLSKLHIQNQNIFSRILTIDLITIITFLIYYYFWFISLYQHSCFC